MMNFIVITNFISVLFLMFAYFCKKCRLLVYVYFLYLQIEICHGPIKATTYQKPFDHQRLELWVRVCSVIADFELRILYMPGLYFIAKLTLSVYHIIRFWFFAFVITLVFWLALTEKIHGYGLMMTSINSKNWVCLDLWNVKGSIIFAKGNLM